MINVYTKAISRKIAQVFALAAEKGYEAGTFVPEWMRSETNARLIDAEVCELGQSALYQFNSFLMEHPMQPSGAGADHPAYYRDAMYWLGYTLSYWSFQDEIAGKEIAENYDLIGILQSFDTLHTLSCKNAIEDIKNDFGTAA